ncbi:MAG: arylsulfatase [Candidatus Binatia bacterium]
MTKWYRRLAIALAVAAVPAVIPAPAPAQRRAKTEVVLPPAPAPFAGHIGRNAAESTPDFPKLVKAPANAPNVLLVLTDDVGFGAAGTFGGLIPTPNLDRLAANGLRYNRFHTTAMCSPTRAALLTGRNHHAVANGVVTDLSTGYPGYWSILPRSAATIAEVLRQNGYNTAFFGKHHLVQAPQTSSAGPFDLWPTGLGFEYFYGFVGAETDQWTPGLYRGISPVDPPRGTVLDKDLADDAIRWIHNQKGADPDKPFFVYYATGTAHEPHQAPKEWIEKFRGRFDQGWDKVRDEIYARQKAMGVIPPDAALTPRPDGLPAWDTLSPDEKRVSARMMEVFAAMLSYQDNQFGRIVDELERMGQLANTLIVFIEGDNGAAAEGSLQGSTNAMAAFANGASESQAWLLQMLDEMGGPNTRENYPIGWAWAMSTPFPWFKQYASHLGGTRNGMVISWPARIESTGGLRSQFHHLIDIMPTILEAAGVPQPAVVNGVRQQPIDGVSLAYTFDTPDAADRHVTQYFEMMGNRAIYDHGWLASTTPKRLPWATQQYLGSADPDKSYAWELYDLRTDYSQSRNLAATEPAKLKALQALWWKEAERNKVLPLDDRLSLERFAAAEKAYRSKRTSYVYWGGDVSIADAAAPPLLNRSFSVTADVAIPQGGGEGVLLAYGGRFGGWSFYLKDGKPVVLDTVSRQPKDHYRVAAPTAVPPGPATLRFDFDYDGGGANRGGLMRISVDGQEIARGRVEHTISKLPEMTETFDVGFDTGTTVSDEYTEQGRFNGDLRKLQVDISPPPSGQR